MLYKVDRYAQCAGLDVDGVPELRQRLSINSNAAEHAIRPLAVGRKSWLCVSNLEAGQRAMVL